MDELRTRATLDEDGNVWLHMEFDDKVISKGYTPDLLAAAIETAQSEWAGLSSEPDWDAKIVK